MSEINSSNNLPRQRNTKIENPSIQAKPLGESNVSDEIECCPECNSKSSREIPSLDVLGRSQVPKADNFAADLKFLEKYPQLVNNANEFFEAAFKAGIPYEEACLLATGGYVSEFKN